MEVDGNAVHFTQPGEAQAKGIATIYQEFSLYAELTVAENIFAGHMPRSSFGAIDWAKASREASCSSSRWMPATLDVNTRVGTLSVGNRQRVEIAKALSRKAQILILDEPTAVLTQHDAERLFGVIRKLTAQKVAVIYISHRLDEIFALSNRVTVLRDGKMVGIKITKETDEEELIRMMVGRTLELDPSAHPDLPPGDQPVVLRATHLSRAPLLEGCQY